MVQEHSRSVSNVLDSMKLCDCFTSFINSVIFTMHAERQETNVLTSILFFLLFSFNSHWLLVNNFKVSLEFFSQHHFSISTFLKLALQRVGDIKMWWCYIDNSQVILGSWPGLSLSSIQTLMCRCGMHRALLSKKDMLPRHGKCYHFQGCLSC